MSEKETMSEFDGANGIEVVLKTLTAREEQVVRMRFGIGAGSEHTLKEVGQKFSVTGERIRPCQTEAKNN